MFFYIVSLFYLHDLLRLDRASCISSLFLTFQYLGGLFVYPPAQYFLWFHLLSLPISLI